MGLELLINLDQGKVSVLSKFSKATKSLTVAACSVLLTGCSFSFVYNHLDWWANWYLDDYVTLNKTQQKAFDEVFNELHVWHRETQLPIYAEQLKQLKADLAAGITEEKAKEHLGKTNEYWIVVREKAKTDLIELTHMLSEKQRKELLANLDKQNQERIENREELSREEWVKEECKEQQSQFKSWVGKLSKSQKADICEATGELQSTFNHWMDYRMAWHNSFTDALDVSLSKEEYVALFAELISEPEKLRSDEYLSLREQNNRVFVGLFAEVMNGLSQKQTNRLNNKIDDFIEDIEDLAQDS
ncbi:MAG: hypothetical protein CL811_09390 [Colwelliaceae bacterium]|nr:hypothetical protein [Colwelliaceae bacterium]